MILALLALTVVGSALFAGLETGMVSLNRVRLRARARRGDKDAAVLLRMLQSPARLLSTFLVGNTLCNVGGGALASYWVVESLKTETLGSVAATLGMSSIFLIFSEVAPKTFFRVRADSSVPRLLWFVRVSAWVFAPVVWATSLLFRLLRGKSMRSPFVTREEVRQLVSESSGGLGVRERSMLQNVFDFGQTVVREVMIPLPDVVSLPETAGTEDLIQTLRRHRFTRLPVFRNRVDTIVGLVNVFDVLYDSKPAEVISGYIRPIHIVPDISRINRVLVELQRRRETMALVVNEFGACIGIVTVEDIVEEILGELTEEHEEMPRPIQRVSDGVVIDSSLDILDLNQELGLSLRKDRYDTVGGMILGRLGRIPDVGERIRVGNLEFEVLAVHAYGLKRLKVRTLEGGQKHT